jgi:hypothetical protein
VRLCTLATSGLFQTQQPTPYFHLIIFVLERVGDVRVCCNPVADCPSGYPDAVSTGLYCQTRSLFVCRRMWHRGRQVKHPQRMCFATTALRSTTTVQLSIVFTSKNHPTIHPNMVPTLARHTLGKTQCHCGTIQGKCTARIKVNTVD